MTEVELLEHHRFLNKKIGVVAEIEDNWLNCRGKSPKNHRFYYLFFYSFLRAPEILTKDTLESFCPASIYSTHAAILAMLSFFAITFSCNSSTIIF